MPFLRRPSIVMIAGMLMLPRPGVAAAAIPSLDGQLTGNLVALAWPDAPALKWKVTLGGGGTHPAAVELLAEGAGTTIRAEANYDASGHVAWRVVEARADLAAWAPAVAARLGADFAGLSLTGNVRIDGEGGWRQGGLTGSIYVSVSNGRLELPSRELMLEGLELEFVLEDLAAVRSAPAQMISWTGGAYGGFPVERGRIMFTVDGDTVQVDEGVVGFLGGQVNLAAFAFSRSKPEMSFITRAVGIDVKLLLPVLSDVLADAQGRLDGTLMFRHGPDGLRLSAGQLSLQGGSNAKMRLAPTPGLITDRVPPRVLEQVPALKKIETGEIPLTAERFDLSFNEAGDREGRSAVIQMIAGPDDPSLRAPVHLTVNVRGPLDQLLRSAMRSSMRFGGSR